MNYYKATIQYDGTNYKGFQWQQGMPTIQNDFNLALEKILEGKVTTMGVSRTDTGVHALHQIVKITSENQLKEESFLMKLNSCLPKQIKCLGLKSCEGSFRPTLSSLKEYRYLFTNKLRSSCVDQRFFSNNPYILDLELMKRSARAVVGRHDFKNFCSKGSNVKTTLREISFCEISEVDPHAVLASEELFPLPHEIRECYQLRIEGSGFLKQMVRHLMSALWLVGAGKLSFDEFNLLLNGVQKDERLWKVASPRGLYLYRITPRDSLG